MKEIEMRQIHTVTVTVNAPDTIGCTAVDGDYVRREVQQLVQDRARRANRDFDSDVRVDSVTVETTEAPEAEAVAARTDTFDEIDTEDMDADTATVAEAVNAIGVQMNAVTETLARLTALADRAERYIGR
jgi:hypothetical protein